MSDDFQVLVGKTIKQVFMNEDYLRFKTGRNTYTWEVYGDCCSHSYFHDFYGVEALIGKKVEAVEYIDLDPADTHTLDGDYGDEIKAYGYRIRFEGDYGKQSAVFSFRNRSNGYYGGSAETSGYEGEIPEIKKDTVLT